MFKFYKQCPYCATKHHYSMDVTVEQFAKWSTDRDSLIQHVMPNLSPSEREVFITGMCYGCQADIFGIEEE